MDISNKYSIFIGTTRGTLCSTDLNPKGKIKYEFPKEVSEISSMVWGIQEDEIVAGFKDGNISLYSTLQQKYINTFSNLKNEGSIVGLGSIGDRVLATSIKGKISILHSDKEIDNIMTVTSTDATVECSSQNINNRNIIATGGEMNDLKLWDIETKQCVFKAKSLGHDELNLPIRTSVRGITFIPEDENVCCCVTKEGHILLYDNRAQRRPVCKFFEPKASYTTIAPVYRQRNILAGTTKGFIQNIDMKTGKCQKTIAGIGGSVTCLLCDPVEPILVTTSLDRYLRVFNLDTKDVLFQQYMKQSLTKILMKPAVKIEKEEDMLSSQTQEDEEYEDIFNTMEVVAEKPLKKKKSKKRPVGDKEYDEIFRNMEVITEKPLKKRSIKNDVKVKNKKIKS